MYYKSELLWTSHPLDPSIVGQSRLPGFNSIQIRFYSDNSQPLRFVHFRIRSNPNGWVYAKAGASGNEGSNTIWYVVDLPDSYVVYSSLIWPDWPVQWYQYKHIYISLLSIIASLQIIFCSLNYQCFAFCHYKVSHCCKIPLKHYHISPFYCYKAFIDLAW